jgi:hypothetical protein
MRNSQLETDDADAFDPRTTQLLTIKCASIVHAL